MRRDDFTHRIYYTAPFPFRLLTGPRMRTVEEEALQRGGAGGGGGREREREGLRVAGHLPHPYYSDR
jgi:hypothetical protein